MSSASDTAAAAAFASAFSRPPDVVASAPGRVNLLGEHTDYNDGFVMPIALAQRTTVALGRDQSSSGVTLHAQDLCQTVRFTLNELPAQQFARYVFGSLREALAAGVPVPPLQIHVSSDVPMGVGLSSSAALEVATLRAICALSGSRMDDVQIAKAAQRAEVAYAGVRCGIMDQMASSLARPTHALWLDTRSLQRKLVPLPEGGEILVLDSGIARSLAASGYNTRRAECEAAARLLGVASLRDLSDPDAPRTLPDPLQRRVRHVLTENARVVQAVGAPAHVFGQLMNASHTSMRDDYEVSTPAIDRLVEHLQRHRLVFGARLTGGGFGGACVALCHVGSARQVAADVIAQCAADGIGARLLVPAEAAGSP